jgi:hypothetical protein
MIEIPTANPIVRKETSKNVIKIIPTNEVNKWPKKIFLG